MGLKWVKHDDYAIVSSDGRYSVCKIGGREGYFYEAWRRRAHPEGPHLIAANLKTSAEAKKLAEEDAREA